MLKPYNEYAKQYMTKSTLDALRRGEISPTVDEVADDLYAAGDEAGIDMREADLDSLAEEVIKKYRTEGAGNE
jgi:hypothetical protein